MKITTRAAGWGIELKNDTVSEDIYNNSSDELRETSINFLEAVKDLINAMPEHEDTKDSILVHLDRVLSRLEEI